MSNFFKIILIFYCFISFFLSLSNVHALNYGPVSNHILRLDEINKEIETAGNDEKKLKSIFQELTKIKDESKKCVEDSQTELEKININLEAIGEPIKGESKEISKQRKSLNEQKESLEKSLKGCKYLTSESSNLINKVASFNKYMLKSRFFNKEANIFELFSTFYKQAGNISGDIYDVFITKSNLSGISLNETLTLLFLFFSGILITNRLIAFFNNIIKNEKSRTAFLAIKKYLFIPIPSYLITTGIFTIFFDPSFIFTPLFILLYLFCVSVTLQILIRLLLILHDIETTYGKKVYRDILNHLNLLTVTGALFLIFNLGFISSKMPAYLASFGLSFFSTIFVLSILFFLFRKSTRLILKRLVTVYTFLAFPVYGAIIITELIGYRNFSNYLLEVTLKTTVLIGIFGFINNQIRLFFAGLSSGEKEWQIQFREILGIKKGEYFSVLIWLQFLCIGVVLLLFLLCFVYIITLSENINIKILEFISDGFKIAKIHISPLRIIIGFTILLLLIGIIRWIKRNIATSLISREKIEYSEIESIVTVVGYAGYIIAFFIFLAFSGFDISNLALIGGALSVGIGFGLQNIVNNFVSGLILLFERPIKKGDWIVVNNTEGYVKRISVRSTVIETFDRCDVIVPNSELIANQVQNWMFDDRRGRVRVNVGVAYGSDVELVKNTLIETAKSHPLAVTDGSLTPPIVWFTDFADSSLNFQLLFYIKDIDRRASAASEMRFAIDKAFREKNIQIPFPQRDIHIITQEVRQKGD